MTSSRETSPRGQGEAIGRLMTVLIPVSRLRAWSRALLRAVVAALLAVTTSLAYGRLSFAPTGTNNRIVDYSILVLVLPVALFAVVCTFSSARWLLLACWPGRLGVFASADELILRLGPFGTQRFAAAGLELRYPFELSMDAADGVFEALLPEEEQLARFLPRIRHPNARDSLDRKILRFSCGTEDRIATTLRPVFDVWRTGDDAKRSDVE